MKVLFLTHYSELYGANRSLATLLHGLSTEHELAVVAPGPGPALQEFAAARAVVRTLPLTLWTHAAVSERLSPAISAALEAPLGILHQLKDLAATRRALRDLFSLIRQFRPDVIHTNTSLLALGSIAASISGTPHVWHLRELVEQDYGLRFDLGRHLSSQWIGRSHAVVAISKAVRECYFPKETPSNIHVVYNGVFSKRRFDELREQSKSHRASNDPAFLIIGMIHPSKGQSEAIRALEIVRRHHSQARLVIVGDGDPSGLQQLCRELGLENAVSFVGYASDPTPHYLASTAVLMCSRAEAMGRVTAEAMGCRRLVIGRASGATPELIRDGETGLLYDGTHTNLAEKMILASDDADLREKLSEAAWHFARAHFANETYVSRMLPILTSACT